MVYGPATANTQPTRWRTALTRRHPGLYEPAQVDLWSTKGDAIRALIWFSVLEGDVPHTWEDYFLQALEVESLISNTELATRWDPISNLVGGIRTAVEVSLFPHFHVQLELAPILTMQQYPATNCSHCGQIFHGTPNHINTKFSLDENGGLICPDCKEFSPA